VALGVHGLENVATQFANFLNETSLNYFQAYLLRDFTLFLLHITLPIPKLLPIPLNEIFSNNNLSTHLFFLFTYLILRILYKPSSTISSFVFLLGVEQHPELPLVFFISTFHRMLSFNPFLRIIW